MKTYINSKDPYAMNWIEGEHEWGTVICPEGISYSFFPEDQADVRTEKWIFTNTTESHIFTSLKDIAIDTPFNDDYSDARICMTNRCHTHIWCGGNISYVMALRMGGMPPHLGLILTEGSLGGYSVQRDPKCSSNDRGDFLLHPSPMILAPGESSVLEWKLFWHEGKKDFYEKVKQLNPRFLSVKAEHYVVFKGEKIRIAISPVFSFDEQNVSLKEQDKSLKFTVADGEILLCEEARIPGVHRYEIQVCEVRTFCEIFVQEDPGTLARSRCRFIADRQQYLKEEDPLDGAYLAYDNEENHLVYQTRNDLNAARERVGMGLLMEEYLKYHEDPQLSDSLRRFAAFVKREILNERTGEIANDYRQDTSFLRLYNYPWYSRFFAELYDLSKDRSFLEDACQILFSFYAQGGERFYAIELPVCRVMELLKEAEMTEQYQRLLSLFERHCSFILGKGKDYPAHEVNYEQSIVAPAADILLQMYELTKEKKYLEGAEIQLQVLELFQGTQPDFHLYETAIRHWDGYWFGKRRLFGDTFPHYWSALTANVYERYGRLTGNESYLQRAEDAFRGVLPLFAPDGRASCAYLYPVSVNGCDGKFFDPYANDQDWGLYFMLRHCRTH